MPGLCAGHFRLRPAVPEAVRREARRKTLPRTGCVIGRHRLAGAGSLAVEVSVIESELLTFVRASIRSVWNVELLLWLFGAQHRAWAAEELVRGLRASGAVVNDGLSTLETAGLVSSNDEGGYRYAPASAAFDRLTRELDALYRERPLAVTEAIFSSDDKLRTFADAFRLKKE
jgi:hypothetical protein